MNKRSFWHALLMASLLLSFSFPAFLYGQVGRGTINGTIKDQSGAVIPGVQVTATNLDTGMTTSVSTNADGLYAILNQPVGRYSLRFEKQGFRQIERKGITLSTLQVAEIDVTLTVGTVSEVVNVTEDAPVIETETSNIGSDIKSSIIADLPLNVGGGRNVENFAFAVMPGVEGNSYAATINGTQNFTKDVKIDGTTLTATVAGDQGENGPSMEAVQEVDVQTSGLGADNASTNGGVELFTLKSGTNQFHGSAFGYGHNEILDANTWSNDNQGIRKAKSRFWDYGFSAGGPIIIPKLYQGRNKTFIFGAYERYQQNDFTLGSPSATVPTTNFLNGDFSALLNTGVVLGTDKAGNTIYQGAIIDPTTGNVFSGNIIPSARFSAVSKQIVALYQKDYKPASTAPSQNEAVLQGNTPSITTDEITIKADHNFSEKNHLSGSYIYNYRPRLLADLGSVWEPGSTNGGPFADSRTELVVGHAYRVSDSYTIKANLLNVASLTYNRYWNGNAQIDTGDWPSTLGFGETGVHNFPTISFGAARNGITETGIGNTWTNHYLGETYVLNDTVSWVRGRHTMKFGGEFLKQPISSDSENGALSVSFDPSQTGAPTAAYASKVGFGFASFLLGDVYNASSGVGLLLHGRRGSGSLFGQDDFKVNNKLTLNLGLRWDFTTPLTEKDGRWANFDTLAKNPSLGVLGLQEFASGGSTTFEGSTDWKQFGPHVGFAYQVTNRLVARASYGLYYVPIGTNFWNGTPYGFAPGYRGTNIVNPTSNFAPAFNWDKGYPGVLVPPVKDPNALVWGEVNIDPHTLSQGYTHQFNAGVEFGITKDMRVSVNYVGNRGERLHDGNLAYNEPAPATYLKPWQAGTEWNWVSDAGSAAAAGVPYPYPGFAGYALQAVLPFPQVALTYGPLYYVGTPKGKTTYDAMQVEVIKRTGSSLTFDMSYNSSRSLGNTGTNFEETWTTGGFQDFTKIDQEASIPSGSDVRQIVKGYVSYELPLGRGKRFLATSNAVDKFVGGWHATTLLHYNSGAPIFIWAANPYYQWAGVYPNVNKQGDFGRKFHYGNFVPPTGSNKAPAGDKYFDGSLFSQPTFGQLGTGPEASNQLRGFGHADEDAALLKYTSFGSDGRYKLSIRVEFYDLLNRHYFNNPNTDITSPAFGYVTGLSGTSRNGQFGARFQW
jgi:hypothetical protein